MLLLFIGFLVSLFLPMQTAINTQLKNQVNSPLTAAMISFVIGTIFIFFVALFTNTSLTIPNNLLTLNNWWLWLGGLLGATWITINIYLFTNLGSIQATLMPLLGQIIMSMIIDHFGLLNSLQQPFDLTRLIGIILVLIGVILAVYFKETNQKTTTLSPLKMTLWQCFGVIIGMVIAIQGTINGQFGIALQSPIKAALFSFTIGSIVMIIVTLFKERTFSNILLPIKQKASPLIWIGGLFGAIYVIIIVILVNNFGIGQAVVIGLFGQICGSIIIEHFGLLKAKQSNVKLIQIIGLIIMFGGIIIIKLL
ncbi:DMT family transporter [Erysipelotrichaceae bacterium OttesenSCG-928-M19]|nr:DMT family transporter [Erysipelotrichaceae bacterium OttesenSCG-928-M19]